MSAFSTRTGLTLDAAPADAPSTSTNWFGLPSLLPTRPLSARRLRGGAAPASSSRRGPVFGLFGKKAAAESESDGDWEEDTEDDDAADGGWRDLDEGYVGSAPPEGLEQGLSIRRIAGDGRCMFRALARGMALNQNEYLAPVDETREADNLRLAVRDALCRSDERRALFQEAVTSIQVAEGGLPKYCARLNDAGFWGGEVELMVLSRLLRVPLYVYKAADEAGAAKEWWGYVPIVKYGTDYEAALGRKPVHLLYYQGNHYDLLVQ